MIPDLIGLPKHLVLKSMLIATITNTDYGKSNKQLFCTDSTAIVDEHAIRQVISGMISIYDVWNFCGTISRDDAHPGGLL